MLQLIQTDSKKFILYSILLEKELRSRSRGDNKEIRIKFFGITAVNLLTKDTKKGFADKEKRLGFSNCFILRVIYRQNVTQRRLTQIIFGLGFTGLRYLDLKDGKI